MLLTKESVCNENYTRKNLTSLSSFIRHEVIYILLYIINNAYLLYTLFHRLKEEQNKLSPKFSIYTSKSII